MCSGTHINTANHAHGVKNGPASGSLAPIDLQWEKHKKKIFYETTRAEVSIFGMQHFMDSLTHDNQADVIEAFNSTSRYLDDLLNIDNPFFEGMVNQIYPSELQLNKANISDTEASFLRSTSFCCKWICFF